MLPNRLWLREANIYIYVSLNLELHTVVPANVPQKSIQCVYLLRSEVHVTIHNGTTELLTRFHAGQWNPIPQHKM